MAKLLSGTRIYGNAFVDAFINVGGNVNANGTISTNALVVNGVEIFSSGQGANITVTKITANIWNNLYTSNVIEGINLYFTNARVLTALTNSTVQGNLNLTDGLTANTVTANSFISTGTGVPTLSSATNINLAANGINGGAVVVQSSALRLNPVTKTVRDTFTPSTGDLVYNSNTATVQVYGSAWKDVLLSDSNANLTSILATGNITANSIVSNSLVINGVEVFSSAQGANITVTKITANIWNGLYTANVIETASNLYFTNARVLANVSQMSINVLSDVDITGIQTNGILSWNGTAFVAGTVGGAATSNTALVAFQADHANTADNSNVANSVLSISNFTTANLAEGSNLYFTNARVFANVAQMSVNVFTDVDITGVQNGYALVWNGSAFIPTVVTAETASIANVAYTANIANTVLSISNFTTANLVEGTKLYYTNARVISAVTPYLTTANVVEGTNLYYTNARVLANLATSDVSVNNLTVAGDLVVQGNTVTLNASTVNIEDKNLLLANGAINAAAADGAGISIAGANANITYASTGNKFVINKPVDITGEVNTTGNIFVNGDQAITLNPLNQSLALLRSQIEAPVSNVLYVSKSGNDNNSGNSVANALANIHTALNRANSWTTVFVKSGEYTLYQQPVTIKKRVGLVGDNLRTTTIRPANVTQDMFYVNNACYVTGFTFRDHQSPSAVFSYNPDGSAGFITTSPYIQNSSSITTTGTGLRVNGDYVSGLRSVVVDSYTQTNEGGIGIHMLNRGYTQLVSVFTICCDIAILAENGGFCSITNSNASFGRLGLVARGVSTPLTYGVFTGTTETDTGTQYIFANLTARPNYGDAVLFANYNRDKCARDTGLILDSLAIDLAYGSNTQSAFAGLQYWGQSTSAIANEQSQTVAAISFVKSLAANVTANVTPTQSYQANVFQVRGPGGNSSANINAEFDLIANIITGGTVGVTDRIIPNGLDVTSNVSLNRTANLLLSNKSFIAAETVAYIRQTYPGFFSNANNFVDVANSEITCSRDVGYMIDSVTFDLLHGGNRQAIMSGTYYYNYSVDTTQINNQVVQTGAAYNYIGSIISNIVTNKKVAAYNQEKCERDTGLIVDALAFDLAYSGNTQANFAGLQYWSQTESAIKNQNTETLAAITYAKQLASNVVLKNLITSVKQANVTQSLTGLAGTEAETTVVDTNFELIKDIIANGTVGVTDRIVSNQYPANTNVNVSRAANLITNNKSFIQAEVIAYVNQTYPGFFANANNFVDAANAQTTCSRDVGYLLDSIIFDLKHGGNKQSVQSGTYYYNYNANTTQINNQIVKTGQAYDYIGSIIGNIIQNLPVTTRQTYVTQNTTAATAATSTETATILTDISLITSIITNGPSVAKAKLPIGANASTNANVVNATKIILANKEFIKAETIAYINDVLFDPPYQILARQNTTAASAATYTEANLIINNINLITNIVSQGPSVAPPKRPINGNVSVAANSYNAAKIVLANKDYITAEVLGYISKEWANISNGSVAFYTVANSTPMVGNVSYVTLLEGVTDTTILANSTLTLHQPSYISALGYTFEYIGSGTSIQTALPYNGGFPIQDNEVTEEKGGRVYFTSTDQQGDFRIGTELVFNRVDGTISGRTFNKALFSVMTPYILAIEG